MLLVVHKSEADVLDEVGRQLPNVPVDFLERKREVNWRRRRNRVSEHHFQFSSRVVSKSLLVWLA